MSDGINRHAARRSLPTNGTCRKKGELVDAKTQTNPFSLQVEMERFEKEVELIISMKELRYGDALRTVTDIMKTTLEQPLQNFKFQVLKVECLLHLLQFEEAKIEGMEMVDLCSKVLNINEVEVSNIALLCRENNDFVRALLYYQCSLHCWLRDMRNEKIRRRTIDVITRGEKYALTSYHIGLSADTRGIFYEYAIPAFCTVMEKYEIGPPKLEVHRDLSIMGCYYHIGESLKKLGDFQKSIELTKEGINIGMKTMKEHKNYLLPKSHHLVAECYLELGDHDNAKRWLDSALRLCPFIVNWDFQSTTERKKEFEKHVNERLKHLKTMKLDKERE
uniref:uncharacterized protein LOC120326347 n=1 Tax=Styela clava TaxID=7725 RepID=UPI00193AA264|nr:uncharacterized protein LOC120326347 [Styela clava]